MNLQLLMLMAGPSTAFQEAGYHYPKNLIEIDGLPLAQHVLESHRELIRHCQSVTCVVPKEEDKRFHTGAMIHLLEPKARVVTVKGTAGAACSAMLAMSEMDLSMPLAIVNGDQILDVPLVSILDDFQAQDVDGGILVFEAVHPRWSFVRCDEEGWVVETAEKRPISQWATAGFYYFARAGDFFEAAREMIKKDAHVDGVFYICPAYNEMILKQQRITVSRIPKSAYWSLAAPAGVKAYEKKLQKKAGKPS